MGEKVLEEQLLEVGKKLVERPAEANELLSLLEKTESYLQRVEQSPSASMLSALEPSKDALVAAELLRHSDMDVKVLVASCISEITRITAPEAPYNDDLMKEIFQIIVASFENLFDQSSRSHAKRVSILETVAKVRSCVVMLDLECDDLILEMFQHFLKPIRDNIQENVFSSMETIMTLVVEESEDISSDLLNCLLTSVEKEKQNVSPVAYKLGEKVLKSCNKKLRSYMLEEVKTKEINLDNYSTIVASICEETTAAADHDAIIASEEKVEDEIRLSEKSDSDEPPQLGSKDAGAGSAVKSSTSAVSNGTIQAPKEPNSLRKKPEHSLQSDQSKTTATVKSESDQVTKRRGRKPSAIPAAEASESNPVQSAKEAAKLLDGKVVSKSEAENTLASGDPAIKGLTTSRHERKTEVSSPIGAQSPRQGLTDSASRPKRGRPPGKKKLIASGAKADHLVAISESKASVSGDQIGQRESEIAENNKETEKVHDSEVKPQNEPNESFIAPKKSESLQASDRNAKKEVPVQKLEDKAKRRRGSLIAEKGISRGSSKKRVGSAEKSIANASTTENNQSGETPKMKQKRKRGPTVEVDSEIMLDDKIVGKRIKVWWPEDKAYYTGVVDHFDPINKKHKILYDDGDEEILFLKDENWKFVKDDDLSDGDQNADATDHDASSERPQKKMNKNSEGQSKQTKIDGLSKRGEPSNGKQKNDDTKSGAKIKANDTPKTSGKAKEGTPKTGSKAKDDITSSKSKEEGSRSGTRSKEDFLKLGSRLKEETTPKSGIKSKGGEMSKTGGKSNTNGSSLRAKLGSSKNAKSEDTVKAKSSPSDAQESDPRGGKKRRRLAQS